MRASPQFENLTPWTFLVILTTFKLIGRPSGAFTPVPLSEISPLIWEAIALAIAAAVLGLGRLLSRLTAHPLARVGIAVGTYVMIPAVTLLARGTADTRSDVAETFLRFPESLSITLVSAGLAIVLVFPLSRVRERERELVREETTLAHIQATATQERRDAHNSISSQVTAVVVPEVNRVLDIINSGPLSAKRVDALVADIQHSISGVLKPFSHRLISQTSSGVRLPRPALPVEGKALGVNEKVPVRSAIVPAQTGAILATFFVAIMSRDFPDVADVSPRLVALCIGLSLGLGGLLSVIRRLVPQGSRLTQPGVFVLTAGLLIPLVSLPFQLLRAIPGDWLGYSTWGFTTDFPNLLVTSLTSGIALAAGGVFYARKQELITRTENLQAETAREISALRAEIWHINRQTALMVHGSLQGALIATSLQLQKHGTTELEISTAIERLERGLTDVTQTELVKPVREFLDSLAEAWSGIVTLRWRAQEETLAALDHQPVISAALAEVAREGVNNAIFHGNAHTVDIVLDITSEGNVQIVVEDDGDGTSGKHNAGLGTELLDSVTICWALTSDRARTRLSAELAILKAD